MANTENKKRNFDIIPKIICVILAVVLWFYVSNIEVSDHEETYNGVEVELLNTGTLESEHGLYVYSGFGNTISVTLYGKKSLMGSSDDIKAYVDLKDVTDAGKYTLPITVETPSGTGVKAQSETSLAIAVDVKATVQLDVKPKIISAVIASGCEIGDIVPEFSILTASGPEGLLKDIDYAEIKLELGEVNSSVSKIEKVGLVSKSGISVDNRYIQLNKSEMKVTVPVYTTKTLPLYTDSKYGYFNDGNVKISIEPEKVDVKGDPKILSETDGICVATLDETAFSSDVTQIYKLSLPEGLTLIGEESDVYVSVAHIGTTVKTFAVKNIALKNNDKNKFSLITKSLSVKLRGPEDKIKQLTDDKISVYCDVSSYDAGVKGNLSVPALIVVDGYDDIYAIGDYTIQIEAK